MWPQEFPWGKFAKLPSVASHFASVEGVAARNVTAALTDFLITSDCYPLRGDFGLRHGVWRGAHLLGPGLPASLTPWLVCRFAFISLPHWPIIKPQNQRQKQTRKKASTLLAMNSEDVFSPFWWWSREVDDCGSSFSWRSTSFNRSAGRERTTFFWS